MPGPDMLRDLIDAEAELSRTFVMSSPFQPARDDIAEYEAAREKERADKLEAKAIRQRVQTVARSARKSDRED